METANSIEAYLRRLPRISLTLPIKSYHEVCLHEATIENFTPEGFFISTRHPHPGDILSFAFKLPDSTREIKVKAETIWHKTEEETISLGVKVVEISDNDRENLQKYYLSQLPEDIAVLIAPLLDSGRIQEIFPVSDYELAYNFLSKLFTEEDQLGVISEKLDWIAKVSYEEITKDTITLLVLERKNLLSTIFEDKHVRVCLGKVNDNLFYFHSVIQSIEGDLITIALPNQVFSVRNRRRNYRAVQDPSWKMQVEIPLPYPSGRFIRKDIVDLSSSGLAFKIKPDEIYFLPGTPLSNIGIYRKGILLMNTQAEVRHITPLKDEDGGSYLKIGIQFRVRSKRFLKGYLSTGKHVTPSQQNERTVSVIQQQEVSNQKELEETETRELKTRFDKLTHLLPWESRRIDYKNHKNEEIAAILDWTAAKGQKMPVIVISPAYGKKKESTSLLSSMILQNFFLHGKRAAVLRYDGIQNAGESFKEISCREAGKHNLHMTLSQSIEDLKTTIDFCYNNEWLVPEKLILCSPSLSAVAARRTLVDEKDGRIHAWICPMGAVDPRATLTNASGGIDYLDIIQQGKKAGIASILGINVDWDNFWADAILHKLANFEDTAEEIKKIAIPVGWISGIFDAWISADSIKDLLKKYNGPKASLHEIATGHLPLNGKEAIKLFSRILTIVWDMLFHQEIEVIEPSEEMLKRALSEEWCGSHICDIVYPEQHWSKCIVEQIVSCTESDVVTNLFPYKELVSRECELLDLQDSLKLADIGCANHFLCNVIKNKTKNAVTYRIDSNEWPLLDKDNEIETQSSSELEIHYLQANLDLNPLLPIKHFCDGDFYDLNQFNGMIEGLTEYSIYLWKKYYSEHLFYILHGKNITKSDIDFLSNTFPEIEKEIILDINKGAQFIQNLCTNGPIDPSELKTSVLSFRKIDSDLQLPLESDFFDRVISTLMLSYVRNPFSLLKEAHRMLKKGGSITASVFTSEVNISKRYVDFVKDLLQKDSQFFSNALQDEQSVQSLLAMEQTTTLIPNFLSRRPLHFYDIEQVESLFGYMNFKELEVIESYDDPPLALIVRGLK